MRSYVQEVLLYLAGKTVPWHLWLVFIHFYQFLGSDIVWSFSPLDFAQESFSHKLVRPIDAIVRPIRPDNADNDYLSTRSSVTILLCLLYSRIVPVVKADSCSNKILEPTRYYIVHVWCLNITSGRLTFVYFVDLMNFSFFVYQQAVSLECIKTTSSAVHICKKYSIVLVGGQEEDLKLADPGTWLFTYPDFNF